MGNVGTNVSGLESARFIDVHYHANPDAFHRRHSALEAGKCYKHAGGWVVLKNHLGCTAAQAYECHSVGLPVSGSVVLNEIAGGLNWRVVERSLCMVPEGNGRLIVHLPTVTGRAHSSRLARSLSHALLEKHPIGPCTVTDDSGAIKREVDEILRLCCDYPVILSTGHASRTEVFKLVDAAIGRGTPRVMLNQPANPLTGLSAVDLQQFSSVESVYIEQCALTYVLGYQHRDDFSEVLKNVKRVIYSSDFGQTSQPDVDEWLTLSQRWFQDFGLSQQRRDEITRTNPLRMLT